MTAFPLTASCGGPRQKPLRLLTCALLIPASHLCLTGHDGGTREGGGVQGTEEGFSDDLLESAYNKGDLGQAAYQHRDPERLSVGFSRWYRTRERARCDSKGNIVIFASALMGIYRCNKCLLLLMDFLMEWSLKWRGIRLWELCQICSAFPNCVLPQKRWYLRAPFKCPRLPNSAGHSENTYLSLTIQPPRWDLYSRD